MRIARLGIVLVATLLASAPAGARDEIVVATTTSVRDSGLFDALLPLFEERTGIHVKLVAVGSGAALRLGAEGNADALVTHAPSGEEQLVASGAALERTPFMQNFFVFAGPPDDPAGVAQASDGADAMRRLAKAQVPYVSRADDSGTHRRERALLRAAGLDEQRPWEGFSRSGTGMGITLQVAGERRAYALTDVGTHLAFRERTGLEAFGPLSQDLRNVYSVLRIDPERFPGRIDGKSARRFAEFLVERDVQLRILRFGVEPYGRPVFLPMRLEAPDGADD